MSPQEEESAAPALPVSGLALRWEEDRDRVSQPRPARSVGFVSAGPVPVGPAVVDDLVVVVAGLAVIGLEQILALV